MGRGECPRFELDCKYYPECFSDTDHMYGRPKDPVPKRFANLPENKRQICRAEHDEINATYVHLPLPSLDVMKEAIRRHRNG